jgi:predicted ATPase
LAHNIFLAAPASQPFHFMDAQKKASIFKTRHMNSGYYESALVKTSKVIGHFYPYELFNADDAIALVEKAVANNTLYNLEAEWSNVLNYGALQIKPIADGFELVSRADNKPFELSELSHGELKRFSLYAWLKNNVHEGSIVLMDEVENTFHPDWQYGIVKDLEDWMPQDIQFILATHSYELCQALTPAHVSELETKPPTATRR